MNDQVQEAGRVATRTGRILGALFCLVFVLFGLAVAAFIGHDVWLETQPHFWKPTDCRIVRSEAREKEEGRGAPYVAAVRYAYSWNGQLFTSDRIFRRVQTYSDFRKAQQMIEQYPAEGWAICHVNPVRPGEAVLARRFPWMAFALVVPLLFVALGAVGFNSAIRAPAAGADKNSPESAGPVSSRADAGAVSGCLFIFFLLFFAVGALVFHLAVVRPLLQSRQAQAWPSVSCTILSSQVQRHQGNKGSTYSVDVFYEYEIEGRSYRANRHSFVTGSSSGRAAKEAVVRRYPPGRKTVCFVNPSDPTDAVLDRGLPGGMWMALIPAVFMGVGAFGMVYASRRRGGGRGRSSTDNGRSTSARTSTSTSKGASAGGASVRGKVVRLAAAGGSAKAGREGEPLVFASTAGRAGKFIGFLLFAAFWNGVVSVFLWPFFKGARRIGDDWAMAVFLIPFVLVGLFLVGTAGYQFLAMFAPRARLTLARGALRVGDTVNLEWALSGRVERIETLRLYLEGREEASYRRGTNTSTDRQVFAEVSIATVTDRIQMRAGQAHLTIPDCVVPSFASANNKIVWSLRLKGEIRMFPDIDDQFALHIGPKPAPGPEEKGTA